jgi:EAL domain-containing protein (putative c-di-GMP-specific phosphodiesterase class I)
VWWIKRGKGWPERGDLERAIENGELELEYQPVVELTTRRIIGAEALVRWRQDGVLIPPSDFVPRAEAVGFIDLLGGWVLGEACKRLRDLQERFSYEPPIWMSANISARQLGPALSPLVRVAVEGSGIPARSLLLEITETRGIDDVDAAIAACTSLKEIGVRLAVDNFGIGFASLTWVRRFPMDVLKISGLMVGMSAYPGESRSLAAAVVELALTVGLTPIANGIEQEDVVRALVTMGCATGQGYLFGAPMAFEQLAALLAKQTG